MAIYKVRELQDILCEISEDGYPYVEIREIEADNEFPTSLSFDAITPFESISYDIIESYDFEPDEEFPLTETFNVQDRCHEIGFTYEEIATIHHALKNALEHFKNCESDPSYSKEVKRNIKASSVRCRNLEAKLTKFLNQLSPK